MTADIEQIKKSFTDQITAAQRKWISFWELSLINT